MARSMRPGLLLIFVITVWPYLPRWKFTDSCGRPRVPGAVHVGCASLSGIPFAVSGGILGLYVAGLNASVSAAVGFISLFGVSAMDGILLVSYIRRALDRGEEKEEAIIGAAQTRMR